MALCYSGGLDSELIATCLHILGIPFELYFLDLWGINREAFENNSRDFLRGIGKAAHVAELGKDFFYDEYSLPLFQELGCEYPTYLALTWLFGRIPESQFIVVGDGDLNREGALFAELGRKHPVPSGAQGHYAPFATAAVAYYLWAGRHRRAGEFYFFSSTPGLIASMITDPLFESSFPMSRTRRVIHHHFPELKERPKTTNWDGDAYLENRRIRHWLERNARKLPDFRFWRRGAGTVARLDDIFLPPGS